MEQRAVLNVPAHAMPFLQPGRVCRVCRRPPGVPAGGSASTSAAADGAAGSDLALATPGAAAAAAAADDDDGGADDFPLFSPGDENKEGSWVWGVVVNFERIGGAEGARAVYAVDVLVRAEDQAGARGRTGAGAPLPQLLPIGAKQGSPRVVQARLASPPLPPLSFL